MKRQRPPSGRCIGSPPPDSRLDATAAWRPAYHGSMHHLFLDESGNHGLNAFESAYPVFVLGGVIVADDDLDEVEEAVRAFKLRMLGDPGIILHTADITRNRRGFERLARTEDRARFHTGLNGLLRQLPISVVACAIDKPALVAEHGELAIDPYGLSLSIVVERFCFAPGGTGGTGHIIAESRNQRLDRELRNAWDLLRLNGTRYVRAGTISHRVSGLDFVPKSAVRAGLELADLIAAPLGRWVAGKPSKPDLEAVLAKLRRGPDGSWLGAGLVVLPHKKGRGPLRSTQPNSV